MTFYSNTSLNLLTIGFSLSCLAFTANAACVPSDCNALGYNKSENTCSGDIIRCPFDTSKVFCKALDDNCPSGYDKAECKSSEVQTGTKTTQAGSKCYKCEDYCTYNYSSYYNNNESRKNVIQTSTCSQWKSWIGPMQTGESKMTACNRDNGNHVSKITAFNAKCPTKKIAPIYQVRCSVCCYSSVGAIGNLQTCNYER